MASQSLLHGPRVYRAVYLDGRDSNDMLVCVQETQEGSKVDGGVQQEAVVDSESVLAEFLVCDGLLLDTPLCVGDILR